MVIRKKNKKEPREKIPRSIPDNYFRLSKEQKADLTQKFYRLSGKEGVAKIDFQKNSGIHCFQPTSLFLNRLFMCINRWKSPFIMLEQFLNFHDILIYGNSQQKARLGVELMAGLNRSIVSFQEFKRWLKQNCKMRNQVFGQQWEVDQENMRLLFDQIDLQGDQIIDIQEYQQGILQQNKTLIWFDQGYKDILQKMCPSYSKESPEQSNHISQIKTEIEQILDMLNSETPKKESSKIFYQRNNFDISDISSPGNEKIDKLICQFDDSDQEELTGNSSQFFLKEQLKQSIENRLIKILDKVEDIPNKSFEQSGLAHINNLNKQAQWKISYWKLIVNLIQGIRKSVKSVSEQRFQQVKNQNYKEKLTFYLVPAPQTEGELVFRAYRPKLFDNIRKQFNVSPSAFLSSIKNELIINSLKYKNYYHLKKFSAVSPSKKFIYYSPDGLYLIKQISESQKRFLLKKIKQYYHYIQNNPNTLVCRIFGAYKIVKINYKILYFIVVANILKPQYKPGWVYCLKGVPDNKKVDGQIKGDLQFLQDWQNKIQLRKSFKQKLSLQLRNDCIFLRELGIVDYKFLVGICSGKQMRKLEQSKFFVPLVQKDSGGLLSFDNQKLYFMGIVGILKPFTTKKKIKYIWNCASWGGQQQESVTPNDYSFRFFQFIESIIN